MPEAMPFDTCSKNETLVPFQSGGKLPKYSKYSGVQEWANLFALFVNVESSGYNNLLLANGYVVTFRLYLNLMRTLLETDFSGCVRV